MKKVNIYLIGLTLLTVMFTSCKKYLDLKSNLKLVTPRNLTDLQGLMDDAVIMNFKTTPDYGESSADDYFLLPSTYNSFPVLLQNLYQWIPIAIRYGNDWNLGYQAIYNANLSLELLENVERTGFNQAEWNNIKGSALFFRAYYFLLLSQQYAKAYNEPTAGQDLGIVLRLSSDFNRPSVRASVKVCYEQVIKDLEESLNYLPDYPRIKTRPSKGAAYAMLARTNLYMSRYDQALKWADEALKLNNTLMDYNADNFIVSLTANVPFKKFNSETVFYTEMSTITGLHSTSDARIDTLLYKSYAFGDLRKVAFFKDVNGYQQFKGSYAEHASTFFSGIGTDELFLTRAECHAWLGDINSAMSDLNLLLKKRWNKAVIFLPQNATGKEDALKKIRLERRKELLMRGLRWPDLKRLNSQGENIIISRNINGKIVSLAPNAAYYALPIPSDIIEQTGIQQN